MTAAPHRLLLFAPMIDAELARLLLARYRLPYAEDRHVFIWASLLALLRGRTIVVPMLDSGADALAGPREIVDRFDPLAAGLRLVPAAEPDRARVNAEYDALHDGLASNVASFCYFHLLPMGAPMAAAFSLGVPNWEAWVLAHGGYGVLSRVFTLLLRLSSENAAAAMASIRHEMDVLDTTLSDGRPFKDGEHLTLTDFVYAASLAPLLLPPRYAALLPPLETMPPTMIQAVTEARARPLAAYVGRVYATLA